MQLLCACCLFRGRVDVDGAVALTLLERVEMQQMKVQERAREREIDLSKLLATFFVNTWNNSLCIRANFFVIDVVFLGRKYCFYR